MVVVGTTLYTALLVSTIGQGAKEASDRRYWAVIVTSSRYEARVLDTHIV